MTWRVKKYFKLDTMNKYHTIAQGRVQTPFITLWLTWTCGYEFCTLNKSKFRAGVYNVMGVKELCLWRLQCFGPVREIQAWAVCGLGSCLPAWLRFQRHYKWTVMKQWATDRDGQVTEHLPENDWIKKRIKYDRRLPSSEWIDATWAM